MAYDKVLAARLAQIIIRDTDFYEQPMFGGVGYVFRGNMCFGIWKDQMILRLGEVQANKALKKKNVKPFDITGRAMKGWVMVLPEGMATDKVLQRWVSLAIEFVRQLPRK